MYYGNTMRQCVAYIHDPDTTLNFYLKGYDMVLCLDLSFFSLWYSHTLFGTWVYHHGTMCCIHSWILYDLDLWLQYQNYIFSPWIWVWQNVFALWHRHTKFWHMGVSPLDNMLCTFLTLEWPWPLHFMWVAGV